MRYFSIEIHTEGEPQLDVLMNSYDYRMCYPRVYLDPGLEFALGQGKPFIAARGLLLVHEQDFTISYYDNRPSEVEFHTHRHTLRDIETGEPYPATLLLDDSETHENRVAELEQALEDITNMDLSSLGRILRELERRGELGK